MNDHEMFMRAYLFRDSTFRVLPRTAPKRPIADALVAYRNLFESPPPGTTQHLVSAVEQTDSHRAAASFGERT